MPTVVEETRTVAGVVAELKDELKDFINTRIELLRGELRDKLRSYKLALPVAAAGALLLGTAWLILTGALIAIISAAFYPNRFGPFFALIIVGVAYALGGAICLAYVVREVKDQGLMPKRSIQVLKDDAVWLQSEAKTQV